MKYTPCCGRRCMVHGCKTKEAGGCYCLCRLKDHENTIISLLNGTSYSSNGGIIYEPGRTPTPLKGKEKEKRLSQLDQIRLEIKKYEIEKE